MAKGFKNLFFNKNNNYKKDYNKKKEKNESKTISYKTSLKFNPSSNQKNQKLEDKSENTSNLLDENINSINENLKLINEIEKEKFSEIKNTCSICGKTIYDKYSSFALKEGSEERLICFECAKNEIEKKNNISPRNKLVYLGAGTFGEIRQIKGDRSFIIIKRYKFCSPKHEKFTEPFLYDNKDWFYFKLIF